MNKDGTVLPKVYVPVKASFDAEGNILPTEILWEDGRRYPIDKAS